MKKQNLYYLFVLISITAYMMSCKTPEKKETPDILASGIDSTVNPGDDFFKFAHGTWIKNNPIPASESSWGIYLEIQDENYERLKKICLDAYNNPGELKSTQMIGALWSTGMDTVSIEQKKATELQPLLDKINNIKTKAELISEIAELKALGENIAFSSFVGQDSKNSALNSLYIYQGGIGLPDRDYYFNTDARTVNIRKEYVQHIAKMLILLGKDSVSAEKAAQDIMKLETALAKSSRKMEDMRDPYANYNKFSTTDLSKKFKTIDWALLFTSMNVKTDSVIIGQPEFVAELEKQLNTTNLDTWKEYLTWHLVSTFADALSSDFENEDFHFYGTIMRGQTELRPRWKRVLDLEEGYIGDLLGEEYVKHYFSDTTKARYVKLVDEIIASYREHIQNLDWMGDSTKQKAVAKLNAIRKKVGYPDKWKDYSALSFSRNSHLENIMAGNRWHYNYNVEKLGKPVDRDEWDMTPQTWNAYYNPSNNEIVLPAAIFMIPGIEDKDADDAMVYGYGGASTIGHELTHAFDDEGSQFNAEGNLQNWWTEEDKVRFDKKVEGIVNQFDNYVVLDSMHINGKATAGENMADLAGIMVALDAYKKTDEFKSGKKIGGFTPLQRYFLGYALSWKIISRDESLATAVMTDVHSPAFLRINGPFSDIPEFYEAFNVKEGQAMWRPDSLRVKIW